MNSSKGKQGAQGQKQPTRRSVTQQHARSQKPTKRAVSARPKAASKQPIAKPAQRGGAPASHARTAHPKRTAQKRKLKSPEKQSVISSIASSRIAIVAIIIICAFAVVGVFDLASNWGKAYGNVSINGTNVSGMTADEMRDALKEKYSARVSHAQITIYADEEARENATMGNAQDLSADDDGESGSETNYEEGFDENGFYYYYEYEPEAKSASSWDVDALSLKATVPYDDAIEQALAVGRADGGIAKRLNLLVAGEDIPLNVSFDEGLVEQLASEIDSAIGNPRVDSTVVISDGVAQAVEGHSGMLVDRNWLKDMLSRAMINGDVPDVFVAEASEAQSRISMEQANAMASGINQAISQGVTFSYQGRTWLAGPDVLGDWTNVAVVGEGDECSLAATIDSAAAIPIVVDKVDAEITSDDVIVEFEDSESGLQVHTSGTGNIPEVAAAVEKLQTTLYGPDGLAQVDASGAAPTIEVTESDRPESLSFDDALNLGVITALGEFTTEFSNYEGTENRNHNIKLAADMLDGCIVKADGGTWSFNDLAGDTDEAAGFWTAGSIIDGEIVDSVGGGICQVATTIFNAVLESGVDIVERHNHTMYMANYPTGRDAAIDYPTGIDLIWKNTLDSDIYMRMSYTDTSITVQLYSVYTGYEVDYEVGDWEEGEKYETVFEEDDSLGEGAYFLKTNGEDGTKVMVTRYVSDSKGQAVKTDSFESVYEAQDEVYVVGPGVDKSKLLHPDDASSDSSESTDEVVA